MTQQTINDAIQDIINHTINTQPKPQLITITKIYTDTNHVDCKTETGDTLQYIPTISTNPEPNQKGVLLPLNDDTYIIITR